MINQTFYIIVCDDDRTDLEQTIKMTEQICSREQIRAEISGAAGAHEFLHMVKQGQKADLLLMDVMMPGKDGMELARYLRDKKMQSSIVFISNNREMALQGYEVSAARYLAKPLSEEKLTEAILFCYGQRSRDRELLLPSSASRRKVSPKEIYYIEIAGRKSRIREKTEEWDTSMSISELEDLLAGQGFIRCHQSFLVNCGHVRTFRTSSMELDDGRMIPISKHRIKEVRQAFFDYMRN